MFTKADYIDYFKQIAAVEQTMIDKLGEDLKLVEDPDIVAQLREIAEDEARHYSYVKEILDVLGPGPY